MSCRPITRLGCIRVLALYVFVVAGLAGALAAPAWRDYANKPDDWYRSVDGRRVTENILSWQSPLGSWPKNLDTTANPFVGDAKTIKGTFDNGATIGELRFLARAFRATKDLRCQQAFLKGADHIFEAQYATGGWPQSYPPGNQYHRHITFNDDAMVRLMEFLREVDASAEYDFIDSARRKKAREKFDGGIQCILKCQIVVNGQLTVWCAQHDEVDYRPRPARSFELVSLSGAESAGILQLLMSLDRPGPAVVRAVKAGAEWFKSAQLAGIRQVIVNGDKRIVQDTNAPPLWARFYEIESNRPIFAGREGVKKYDIAEIEPERRNGYAWYGAWGERVAGSYAKWKRNLIESNAGATNAVRLVIVGDSTVCNYPENEPTRGWGQFIQGFFNESVRVINLAKSGRSTKTFIDEGLWQKALNEKPNVVLIQFGHNDSHGPGRPESTDAATTYKEYLRRYIDDARAIGATPLLVTPMCRRIFGPDGKLDDALGTYAKAMKEVAAEKEVGVIDLHTTSGELFQKLGEAGSAELANKVGDRTHFNEKGARAMSELVMKELPAVEPWLRPGLRRSQ